MTPKVSVVMATYNRSNVLIYAIESLRRGTFQDWELIVVGDACTDDTAAVVAAFNDARIRFHNLPVNHGEQSKPNNVGVAMARSEVIAFLNHDDLWFPDHLARATAFLHESGADLVNSHMLFLHQDGSLRLGFILGFAPGGRYAPQCYAPASSWVMKRSLAERLGGWRDRRECWAIPSQDFLFRAHRSGAVLRTLPAATVLGFSSVSRPNSYANRLFDENRRALDAMTDNPRFREELLLQFVLATGENQEALPLLRLAKTFARNLLCVVLDKCGLHRDAVRNALLYRKKGKVIEAYRNSRGLPPVPPSSIHSSS